jgi:hypothetical protein
MVDPGALMTTPEYPAVRMIDNYQEIEVELTKMERTLMEKTGEVSQTRSFAARLAASIARCALMTAAAA